MRGPDTEVDDVSPKLSTERQRHYLARAARVAMKSSMTHQHGCVIVASDGTVLCEGYNHHKVHMSHRFSVHAEVDALRKAKKHPQKLSECEMYVVRVSKSGFLKYSRPCEDCAQEIEKYGVRKVYYSARP